MYFTDNASTCTEIPVRLGRYRTSAPVVTELRIREWRLTTSGVLAPSVWDVESALLRAPSLPLVEPVSSGGLVDSRSSITRSMGILPFKQLMYRWQKLSHNSWTCRQTKHYTLLPHYCKSLKRSLSLSPPLRCSILTPMNNTTVSRCLVKVFTYVIGTDPSGIRTSNRK